MPSCNSTNERWCFAGINTASFIVASLLANKNRRKTIYLSDKQQLTYTTERVFGRIVIILQSTRQCIKAKFPIYTPPEFFYSYMAHPTHILDAYNILECQHLYDLYR